MNNCILFSPIGGHDPISGCRDGAMLHICRTYRPQKVYLYLSREMLDRSRADDRYRDSLRRLQSLNGFTMAEPVLIEREELTQVQFFDVFYTDFESQLHNIHAENPGSRLLVNVSSGTPAMKSALNLLAALAPYPVTAVQVSTPHNSENPNHDDPRTYDAETFWELDEDNAPGYPNRCRETEPVHLLARIKKESIRRLLEAYDYRAALMQAEDIRELLPAGSVALLRAAACRAQLDQSGYTKAMQGCKHKFIPLETGSQRQIFEYILSLQIKLKQGNYADFLRGLTPVVLDLFEESLKKQLNLDIRAYCRQTMKGITVLDTAKMLQTPQGEKIYQALTNGFNGRPPRDEPLSSMHVYLVFAAFSQDAEATEVLRSLREVETKIRNIAAHEIVSVTEEWIYRHVGLRPAELLRILKRLLSLAGIPVKPEYWNSYDEMNRVIMEEMTSER